MSTEENAEDRYARSFARHRRLERFVREFGEMEFPGNVAKRVHNQGYHYQFFVTQEGRDKPRRIDFYPSSGKLFLDGKLAGYCGAAHLRDIVEQLAAGAEKPEVAE